MWLRWVASVIFSTWFDTSAFAPVTTASFGNASRNSLRGPGDADLDLGLCPHIPDY